MPPSSERGRRRSRMHCYDSDLMGTLSDRLGARLSEMRARHDAQHKEMQAELAELKNDLHNLMQMNDQLIKDIGPCDE